MLVVCDTLPWKFKVLIKHLDLIKWHHSIVSRHSDDIIRCDITLNLTFMVSSHKQHNEHALFCDIYNLWTCFIVTGHSICNKVIVVGLYITNTCTSSRQIPTTNYKCVKCKQICHLSVEQEQELEHCFYTWRKKLIVTIHMMPENSQQLKELHWNVQHSRWIKNVSEQLLVILAITKHMQ